MAVPKKKEIMSSLIDYAEQSEIELPIAAAVVENNSGRLISLRHNQTISRSNPLKHAEFLAINEAIEKSKERFLCDFSIFVTLEPCLMCYGAILEARLESLVYAASSEENKMKREDVLYLIENSCSERRYVLPRIISGILEARAKKILRESFRRIRRNKL
jgi:tRNA(adenine34) deaminase